MSMDLPAIQADLIKLKQNAAIILAACRAHDVQLAAVTKVFCAEPVIVQALVEAGVDMLADARILNLERLPGSLTALVWCIWRGASILRVHDVRASVAALRMATAIAGASA